MSESKLVNGFFFKLPHENAPEFVKGKISIKLADFAKFVKENKDGEWMNIQLKISKSGNPYADLDTWKPEQKSEAPPEATKEDTESSDLPF